MQKQKRKLLQKLAERRGLIVLTDSDAAGFLIRNHIKGIVDPAFVKHAYIPDVPGKERRKRTGSRAGTLGVEGMEPEVLLEALRRCGATLAENSSSPVTKADMYALGLSGGTDSARRRKALQKALSLPENLSANALLDAVNSLYDRQEFLSAVELLEKESGCVSAQEHSGGG